VPAARSQPALAVYIMPVSSGSSEGSTTPTRPPADSMASASRSHSSSALRGLTAGRAFDL
jgi:hypothetical protein